jgi:hypothetical protein
MSDHTADMRGMVASPPLHAAKGGLKDWPDEWVCENCAWVKPCDMPRKRVYCRKWKRGMMARSDRACFEETGEMKERREALQNTELSGGGPLSNKTTEVDTRRPLE